MHFIPWVNVNSSLCQYLSLYQSSFSIFDGSSEKTFPKETYLKGKVGHKHFSLKYLEVPQRSFFVFISILSTLKRGLISTAEQ